MHKAVLLSLLMSDSNSSTSEIAGAIDNVLSPEEVSEIQAIIEDLPGDELIARIETLIKADEPTAYDEVTLKLFVAGLRNREGYIKEDLADNLLESLDKANYDSLLISKIRKIIENKHESERSTISSVLFKSSIVIGFSVIIFVLLFI